MIGPHLVPDQVDLEVAVAAVAGLRADLTLLREDLTLLTGRVDKLTAATPPVVVVPPLPVPVPVVPPTSFAVPDLLNNASFETGWDGFKDWSGGTPGPLNVGGFSCVRSQEHASDGLWAVKSTFAPSGADNHVEFAYPFGSRLDVYARLSFFLTGALPTSHRKWIRFREAGFGVVLGGLYLSSVTGGLTWVHAENSQIDVDLGVGVPTFNAWHSIEVEYDRRDWAGPHGPRARFWYENVPVVGLSPTKWFGSPGTAYWGDEAGTPAPLGPYLYAGKPSGAPVPSAILIFDDTINGGNTASGATFYDRIAISTQRIGP